ncbi:hypothetical protein [Chitinophaga ginsengisoli]|uniref:Uncharacterized protein n=1 Tax=Chitinophaga ginsengisoli TaxID=363837 RepID=A0A2P8GM86_9BACT|nr:hypothetical protein [Chitinophaga ginsengisoli]PSL35073.1 hypothetical protein CLV42_102647 [Chitinophaga ginsengisoli]
MPEAARSYTELLLVSYRIPSITAYNRLENSPRTANFDRSLKAEVRDPLWMLTRQWQFGEFEGEDAASPVTAQILGMHTTMDRVSFPKGDAFPFKQDIPLETHVEREVIRPDLSVSVQMGRYFLKLMKKHSLEGKLPDFITRYPLIYAIDPHDKDAVVLYSAVKHKMFDGYRLYQDIAISHVFNTWVDTAFPADAGTFKSLAPLFAAWHERNYSQPANADDTAWLPSQLEYQFSISSPQNQQVTLVADQYYEGHLDWYSFDMDPRKQVPLPGEEGEQAGPVENFVSFLPSPIAFKGMPHPRFWQMEENQTDFGKIDTSVTGMLHLMLAEFGLIYSNDWFMLPYPLAVNTLCEIKGIVITDVFGQEILIRPAGKGPETNWHRWAMFHHSSKTASTNNTNFFYLTPAITKALECPPLEEVNFLRDEMANMVWAVENIVPSHTGKGIRGDEMARVDTPPSDFVPVGNAVIRYVLGTTVPGNWTPFIPVHVENSDTEIRFQRARMPGAKPAYGMLLKEQPAPYFINEEEIPRAGVIVSISYQRTRWLNGEPLLWRGRFKQAGKGEGWSNLKFDQIEDIP